MVTIGSKVWRSGQKDNAKRAVRGFRGSTESGIFRAVSESPRLREPYVSAGCCAPHPGDPIVGYHSHDTGIKVHRSDCANLARAESERLVPLRWSDILAAEPLVPAADYAALDEVDFRILQHHAQYGLDYSLVVARAVQVDKTEAFARHAKLRELGLIERVDKVMIQYRKGIADNKWIKHRNHTYFDLTAKGRLYLDYFNSHGPTQDRDNNSSQP